MAIKMLSIKSINDKILNNNQAPSPRLFFKEKDVFNFEMFRMKIISQI